MSLKARIILLREALCFYADEGSYNADGAPYTEQCVEGHDGVECLDLGERAKQVLEEDGRYNELQG